MSRHVSGITFPSSEGTTRTQNRWLLCAAVDAGWSVFPYPETNPHLQPHTSHQICVRVVPPEDGQVMPETCRDTEHQ
jgi:hypothetical protein